MQQLCRFKDVRQSIVQCGNIWLNILHLYLPCKKKAKSHSKSEKKQQSFIYFFASEQCFKAGKKPFVFAWSD